MATKRKAPAVRPVKMETVPAVRVRIAGTVRAAIRAGETTADAATRVVAELGDLVTRNGGAMESLNWDGSGATFDVLRRPVR